MRIAIDGTASAGKGTLALLVAKRLNYAYIDTGALYRGVALFAKRSGIDWADATALGKLAAGLRFRFVWEEGALRIYCDDEDITEDIRTDEISSAASMVSSLKPVRASLLMLQKKLGEQDRTAYWQEQYNFDFVESIGPKKGAHRANKKKSIETKGQAHPSPRPPTP